MQKERKENTYIRNQLLLTPLLNTISIITFVSLYRNANVKNVNDFTNEFAKKNSYLVGY